MKKIVTASEKQAQIRRLEDKLAIEKNLMIKSYLLRQIRELKKQLGQS